MFLKSATHHDCRRTESSGGSHSQRGALHCFCYTDFTEQRMKAYGKTFSLCVCSVGHLELICVLLSLFPCQASGQFLQVKLKLVQADVGIFSGSEG